jgi:hypothetical protein
MTFHNLYCYSNVIQSPSTEAFHSLNCTFGASFDISKNFMSSFGTLTDYTSTLVACKAHLTSFIKLGLFYTFAWQPLLHFPDWDILTNINKIFLQQKKAIRIITNSAYTAHTAPLFASLSLLPLEKVITHAKLSFMHTVYYGTAPTSFNNIWQTQAQRHPEINLRKATDIYVPFPRIDLFKRMPI